MGVDAHGSQPVALHHDEERLVVAGETAKEEQGGKQPEILRNTPRELRPGEIQGGLRPWLSCLAPPFARKAGFSVGPFFGASCKNQILRRSGPAQIHFEKFKD